MQVIYGDASNIYLTAQKRLIRVVEGQTQATPYACYLDPSLRNSEGNIVVPKENEKFGLPNNRTKTAFTFNNSLTPGLVLVKTTGEAVTIAGGENEAVTAFGLLGQWVGGTFDNIKSTNQVSAWRGPDSVYDLLAPAWNDTGLATAVETAKAGQAVKLYAGADGRLCIASQTSNGSAGSQLPIAEVIERASPSVLRINLLV